MSQHERMILPVVRQVALFHTLDETQLRNISALLQERRYAKDELIFAQGDTGDCLYIIDDGRVRISLLSPDGRELTICFYEPGNAFGEFSVLDGGARSATASALDAVRLFVLYRADFLGLLREDFALVERLLAMLTERHHQLLRAPSLPKRGRAGGRTAAATSRRASRGKRPGSTAADPAGFGRFCRHQPRVGQPCAGRVRRSGLDPP
jgi:CRP/FNR family transcriptional regulator, cyclic AMP receptor protein